MFCSPVRYVTLSLLLLSSLPNLLVAAEENRLSAEELAAGWILLFDGETTFGWQAESKADWKVNDGVITVTTGEPGLLRTTSQFDNYELKLDFKAAEKTNSGIFLRTPAAVTKDDVATKCYELNIAPADNPFPTGSLVGRVKAKESPAATTWQSYEVSVNGPQVNVKLNGQEVASYTDPKPIGRGFIGLQLNSGAASFRNIKLRPLGLKSLFNGKDLTGWKGHSTSLSKFTVTKQGELNVQNGKGHLETEQKFGDFTVQLECISHAKDLNSGLFFRCIPGDVMNGYESQIHNGFVGNDRTKPKDCGTGGIFRQQNARKVVADDLVWFHKTLIASGPHVAAWVNGYQVSDWTDVRQPNENPRKGLRLEAGTLQIQGHDPTTNLSFRNLRGVEMAK